MDSAEVSTPTADSDEQLKQKRKRLSISLETKETIIQECELALQENISFRKLAKKWEMNPQTLSHIWKSREKILELVQRRNKKPPLSANSPLKNKLQRTPTKEVSLTNGTSGVHTSMLTSIDNVLITWVDEQIARDIIVTKAKLCDMAKLLYSNYERKLNPNEECKFEADTSWFRGFMKRFKIKSKLKELVAQKAKYDDKPTCEFIAKFEQTVSKEKYLPEQIFTVDEIGFKWKINGNFQEQVILLLGGNASGDFKLKPLMINYTEAPRALFHVLRNTLPVTYRSNKALRMNNDIFTKWFRKCFCPQVKDYLASKNIEYKVLLLIDSVPAHSKTLSFGKKVNVLSIPPLVSCKIHPMVNSDLRNAFRDAYLKRAMKMAKNYLDSAVKEEKKSELIDFWKSFNIKHCIELVGQAWNEDVTRGLMVNAWKKMYPSNPSTVTEISTLTTMEHLNDERLKNAFDPLRNTYTDDLIDYFEIHSDLIEQYMAGDVQQQLRNGNNVDEYSFTSSPAISELSTTSLTTFRQQSSNLLKRQLKTQPFTSQSSTSSSVSSFPTTTISSVSTSESVSHARKQTSDNMKRPLLKQALLNGSKSVKLNGHVVNSIGSLQQNGISSNGAKDASKMELASKESNDLSPVMRAEKILHQQQKI
ncbi:PREDICTED: tigger transposable element-derived protein 1-like [Rhagoletis zephyria]|uniref:tigger transposable element-derived protein 1-like n=1 Tax=Rhagoletis zephyria TaxID=28612 RepID=UPI0008113F5F|nr:PREDICTED: tigger transposable element-derived protein 1-like [Rhagoletis zephyria]